MALSPPGSNTSTTTSSPPVQIIQRQSQLIVTKLTEHNYLIRKQQVLSAVRGYGIEKYLTGDITPPRKFVTSLDTSRSVPNPEYATFQRQDELLVSWLLSSLSDSILVLMVWLESAAKMWHTLETNFSSRSQAKQMQYKLQLSTMKKGNQSMRDFINKVKLCCDALCAAGHKIKEVDQVLHICAGLSTEYDPIVCAITSRGEPLSLSDASALLLSFEARMEGHNPFVFDENNTLLANVAIQGNRKEGINSGNSSSRARGNNSPRGGRFGRNNYRDREGRFSGNGRQACQICHYTNHTTDKCYYRADLNFTPNNNTQNNGRYNPFSRNNTPTAMVASQDTSYVADSTWFPDSGATNHVTYDMTNLNISNEYQGGNKLHMGNGTGLPITHTGSQHGGNSTPREP